MANPDRPRGFSAVSTLSGRPLMGTVRTVGMGDGEDCFVGDIVNLASGLALVGDTNDAAFLGVAVGFGKVDGDGVPLGPYNPDSLETLYYDDSASTHTEWVCYYVPAADTVFEVQTAVDLSASAIGAPVDLLGTAGDTASGRSRQEVTTSTNADFVIVERPNLVDNDASLSNEQVYVMVTEAEQAFK
jgi:hypothetical protein